MIMTFKNLSKTYLARRHKQRFALKVVENNNIMNTETQPLKIQTSEEFRGEVTIYLSNKHTISFPTEKLIDYIEEHGLHKIDIDGSELAYPNTVNDWLDVNANWDKAVASYYKHVICK